MKADSVWGGVLLAIGVMIVVAFEIIYTLTDIWEMQFGLVLGIIVILIGMISIIYDLEIKNPTKR